MRHKKTLSAWCDLTLSQAEIKLREKSLSTFPIAFSEMNILKPKPVKVVLHFGSFNKKINKKKQIKFFFFFNKDSFN